jgi:hypothetical protein
MRFVKHKAVLGPQRRSYPACAYWTNYEDLRRLDRADDVVSGDELSPIGAGALKKRHLRTLPTDRLLNGPSHLGAKRTVLDEELLCTLIECLACDHFVVKPAQDDHRHMGNDGNDPPQPFQPVSIRQDKVKDDDVKGFARQATQRFAEAFGTARLDG